MTVNRILKSIAVGCSVAMLAISSFGQTTSYSLSESYSTNGAQVTLSSTFSQVSSNANVNLQNFNFAGATDTVYGVNPVINGGQLHIDNTTSANSTSQFLFGNAAYANTTNYPNMLRPGESYQGRFQTDPSGNLHGVSSNGTQTVRIFWVPN
jgi:hypothetical protein